MPGELGNDGFFASKNYVKDHHSEPRLARHARVPQRQEDDREAEGRLGRAQGWVAVLAHISISTTLFDKFTPRPADFYGVFTCWCHRYRLHGEPEQYETV